MVAPQVGHHVDVTVERGGAREVLSVDENDVGIGEKPEHYVAVLGLVVERGDDVPDAPERPRDVPLEVRVGNRRVGLENELCSGHADGKTEVTQAAERTEAHRRQVASG